MNVILFKHIQYGVKNKQKNKKTDQKNVTKTVLG